MTVNPEDTENESATFGAGCFWCVEAVFQNLRGVTKIESGYAGGHVENPTYEEVCTEMTDHAEVCRIQFDPQIISYRQLLEVFWQTHDPTTLNRQGNDVGTQYRSVVLYHSEEQEAEAKKLKSELDESGIFPAPIVTEISPLTNYYPAEQYHQNFFLRNPNQPYCQILIRPKLLKLEKSFGDKLYEKNK